MGPTPFSSGYAGTAVIYGIWFGRLIDVPTGKRERIQRDCLQFIFACFCARRRELPSVQIHLRASDSTHIPIQESYDLSAGAGGGGGERVSSRPFGYPLFYRPEDGFEEIIVRPNVGKRVFAALRLRGARGAPQERDYLPSRADRRRRERRFARPRGDAVFGCPQHRLEEVVVSFYVGKRILSALRFG